MSGNNFSQFRFASRQDCPICQASAARLGEKRGTYIDHAFSFRECVDCSFVFVEDPCIDFGRIYDEAFYHARGADPLTDYMFELTNPAD